MHILLKLSLLLAVLMFGNLDLFCALCESNENVTISNKDLALSFGILAFITIALIYAAHCDPSNIYNITDPGELMKTTKIITPDSQDWTMAGTNHHVHNYVPGDDKFFNEKKR
jgi:hypothetical protein